MHRDAGVGDPPDDLTADDVDDYARRIRDLPRRESTPRFPPAVPIERDDPYNAYVTPFEAESANSGALAGLRVAVKDNLAVRGIPMTAGTDAVAFRPEADATVVERLRRAGATLTGTANMDALALGTTGERSAHGRTENPAAPGRVPGGSSSGSAAAVAGGLADAAIGTDTGGSVRIPASFCGVVGFKPTHRLVSRRGLAPLAPSLDHVGALAGDVSTAAKVIEAVAGADPLDPTTLHAPAPDAVDLTSTVESPPEDLTLGLVAEFAEAATDDVRRTVEDALSEVAADRGYAVETVSLPDHEAATLVNDAQTIVEFAAALSFDGHLVGVGPWYDESWADAVGAFREAGVPTNHRARRLLHLGRRLLDDDGPALYARTWDARQRFAGQVRAALDRVDALVTPTATMVAPAFGEVGAGVSVADTLQNTAPFDNTGHPCVSVPCGRVDGRPVGLQVTTPLGTDALAARVARVFEGPS